MKMQFVTDDGKVFGTREAAEAHETKLNNKSAAFTEYKKKIDAINEKIERLLDEKEALLDEYKEKYMTPEQKRAMDRIDKMLNELFGRS